MKYSPEQIEALLQKAGSKVYDFSPEDAPISHKPSYYWGSALVAGICLCLGLSFWWQNDQKAELIQSEYVETTLSEDLPMDMERANENAHLEMADSLQNTSFEP